MTICPDCAPWGSPPWGRSSPSCCWSRSCATRPPLALGQVVAGLEEGSAEDMHNIMRRLMWHMNEESGNIGWGIPEAFAEILAQHRRLGDEFYPILNYFLFSCLNSKISLSKCYLFFFRITILSN